MPRRDLAERLDAGKAPMSTDSATLRRDIETRAGTAANSAAPPMIPKTVSFFIP